MNYPQKIKKSEIFYLSFLALPLAFVGIPIYLNISDFYARTFDLNLAVIGLFLIFVRVFDAFQDPIIGYFSDQIIQKKISRQKIISYAALLLTISFYLVFNPPIFLSKELAMLWFVASLALTYTFFNVAIINFESLVAIFAKDNHQRITINSAKELLGLIGMILAFILPTVFTQTFSLKIDQAYLFLSLTFAVMIFLAVTIFLPKIKISEISQPKDKAKISFKFLAQDQKFLFFLLIFLVNSIAVSLPAANLNFYVRDVLLAEKNLGWFLAIYFLSACFFIPAWRKAFDKFGITNSWIFSISGSILTFFFAFFLSSENSNYFYLVCIFSGAFLGADLIAAPTILAQITFDKKDLVSSYFSWWNLFTKLGLMIAASGSLIILGLFGYQPTNFTTQNSGLVAFFYAFLPCLLKVIVITLLIKFKKYEN